jgi:two-component system, chemotaxis family, response regulator WspF
MRIAIAHSLPVEAEVLRGIIESRPGHEIAWTVGTGAEAIRKTGSDTPDLLIIDLVLPDLSGAETTRVIMKSNPCAILLITSSAAANAAQVFEAMGNGALDVVGAPVRDGKGCVTGKDEVLKKISTIEKLIRREDGPGKPPALPRFDYGAASQPLVAIGSSTGGPKALAEILSRFPEGLGISVVVVQHLDVQFAEGLVDWLDDQTRLKVLLAKADMKPERDTVFVAGTNDHLILGPGGVFRYVVEPKDYPYRPSVDRFFLSARDCWSDKGIAVLLTGMGRDGAKGLLALRKGGWHTIAQDEATSVVYGMPKAAAELGAAMEVLSIEKIAGAIIARMSIKEGLRIHGIER